MEEGENELSVDWTNPKEIRGLFRALAHECCLHLPAYQGLGGGRDIFELRALHKLAHTVEDMLDTVEAVVTLFERASNTPE